MGVFMSFLLTVPRAGRMLLTEFTLAPDGGLHERLPGDVPCPRILVFGLEGEFFFGSSAALERHFADIEERIGADTRVVVLRMKRVRNPDAVALTLLEGFLGRVEARGVQVLMGGVREHLFEALRRTGLAEQLQDRIFLEQPVRQTSTLLALRRAYELIGAEHCATCPRRAGPARGEGLHYEI
jgi:SulP family sulfate permease